MRDGAQQLHLAQGEMLAVEASADTRIAVCPGEWYGTLALRVSAGAELSLAGDAVLDGGAIATVAWVEGEGSVDISGLTIRGGDQRDPDADRTDGGGIHTTVSQLFLDGVVLEGNRAWIGGGLWQGPNTEVTAVGGAIQGNVAGAGGGVAMVGAGSRFTAVGTEWQYDLSPNVPDDIEIVEDPVTSAVSYVVGDADSVHCDSSAGACLVE